MKEIVLYTVITGNYDNLQEIPNYLYYPSKIDYLCLTNNTNFKSNTYKIININLINNNLKLTNRYYKIIINEYIKNYKKSIYIDGKIKLINNIFHLVKKLINNDIVCFAHYKRKCLYQEGAVLLHPYKQIDNINNITPLLQHIKEKNFPKMFGLSDNCCLIRNHNNKIKNSMLDWYNLVNTYSTRDQLSFMYCIWKHKIKINLIDKNLHKIYLRIIPHKNIKQKNKYNIINNTWVEGYDPYENRKYYFNIKNRLCKWTLDDKYEEEHYKFLEKGYINISNNS